MPYIGNTRSANVATARKLGKHWPNMTINPDLAEARHRRTSRFGDHRNSRVPTPLSQPRPHEVAPSHVLCPCLIPQPVQFIPPVSTPRLWVYHLTKGSLLMVLPLLSGTVERGFSMPKGKIKKLLSDKGFGFILTEEGKDLFFHRTELQGLDYSSLKEGQEVEYEAVTRRGGRPEAAKVKRPSPKTE